MDARCFVSALHCIALSAVNSIKPQPCIKLRILTCKGNLMYAVQQLPHSCCVRGTCPELRLTVSSTSPVRAAPRSCSSAALIGRTPQRLFGSPERAPEGGHRLPGAAIGRHAAPRVLEVALQWLQRAGSSCQVACRGAVGGCRGLSQRPVPLDSAPPGVRGLSTSGSRAPPVSSTC